MGLQALALALNQLSSTRENGGGNDADAACVENNQQGNSLTQGVQQSALSESMSLSLSALSGGDRCCWSEVT
jgi:hypothetical protein